ncbi:hypothetical protein acdb102_22240 [Acidothermaceae bacterium B102]|nr:hypothetical protein acdb102_22240 [Acidothermaceae bacterium B102]
MTINVDTRTNPSSTIRPQAPVLGAHSVWVAFSVWGAQPASVTARDGGGPQDRPYLAVSVGDCLSYVYDRDALFSYVNAWREAARQAASVLLPPVGLAAGSHQVGQGTSVLTNVVGPQRYSVVAETSVQGTPVLAVRVGALTVRVHAAPALRSYLTTWNRAESLATVLDLPAAPRQPRRRK